MYSYGPPHAKAGRPARTYIQQLCEDTRCSPEDLPEAMNDREKWRERVRDIRASGTTWWWFFLLLTRFFTCQRWWYVHWSLIDIKSLPVPRTLLSILGDLNAVVKMVSSKPLISYSSSSLSKPFQLRQLQRVSWSPSFSLLFFVLRQGASTCFSFCPPWFLFSR